MANQEDRELELALALSAKEERERQEKVRGPAFAGPAHLLWTLPRIASMQNSLSFFR